MLFASAWSVTAGQTGTHKLWAPHLQIPTRDCSLPWMPFPPLSSSPSSFLLPAGICNFHSANRTRFVFIKYNKQMHRNGNPWVTSGWNQAECVQQSWAVRKDQRWQDDSFHSPFRETLGLFLIQPWWFLQQISPLNTQLETSLREQKPRSKRNTNYCSDLDLYLGLSLLVWKWKSKGLRFKQIKYNLLLP